MDFRYAPPPPPTPSPSSSDPHRPSPQQQPIPPPPGAYYSGQFQYPSPSPPPPQWGPQLPHPDHHLPPPPPPHHYAAGPPQPMTYSSNPYSFPPRPHYPPVNQEWSNTSWGHLGFDYSAQNKNDDDWAARAKAWAASKTVTDEQHHHSQLPPANRPEEIHYQDQYSQNVDLPYQEFQQHSLAPSNYQQYSSFAPQPRPPANHLQEPSSFSSGYASDGQFSYSARDGNVRDSVAAYPHQETTPTSLSVHQQEVPSSYSSVAGKDGSRDMNGNFYQQSHTPYTSASQHQVQPSLSSNDRPFSIEQQPQYAFNNTSVEPPTDLSNQPLDIGLRYGHDYGPFGQSDPPGMPFTSLPPVHSTGQQADPSVGVPSPASMHSTPLFGGISNTTFPIGTSNVFHGDTYGTPGFLDRPKKASVPNWLREEIIKKKAVIGSSAQELSRHDTEFNEDEEIMDRSLGKGDQMDGKSMESTRSKEEEDDDDEDDVELARTAAMNAEIKRLLTEVLLKVTDELFDEIATKVLDEDELNVEVERKAIASSDTLSTVITPKSSAKVLIPAKAKGIDSPGDVLGLGNYASDDDEEEEKEVQNSSIPSSNSSKPAVHQGDNGSSLKNLLEERDSHEVSPKRAIGNDNTREEKVIPGSVDFKKSKQSVTDGLNTENSLPDDSQGKIPRNEQDKIHMKVDEKSRVHDEKYAKRTKKEQNGSKEKIKERDSGKQDSKAEVKDDKKDIDRDRRSREKEDSRKRERGKDDKNEWSKYKPVGDSSKHKTRHRSPSPGGRGRGNKDRHAHRSSDSSSSDSRRNVRSRRRDLSPSPVKSRRQVSRFRSPPSKHSHRRHSNYSSLESTRERRRSRSRSRRG